MHLNVLKWLIQIGYDSLLAATCDLKDTAVLTPQLILEKMPSYRSCHQSALSQSSCRTFVITRLSYSFCLVVSDCNSSTCFTPLIYLQIIITSCHFFFLMMRLFCRQFILYSCDVSTVMKRTMGRMLMVSFFAPNLLMTHRTWTTKRDTSLRKGNFLSSNWMEQRLQTRTSSWRRCQQSSRRIWKMVLLLNKKSRAMPSSRCWPTILSGLCDIGDTIIPMSSSQQPNWTSRRCSTRNSQQDLPTCTSSGAFER